MLSCITFRKQFLKIFNWNAFASAGIIWTDVLLMEEVLPEAGLADFSLQVSVYIFHWLQFSSFTCAGVIWIDICLLSCSCWRFRVLPHLILFQAAHVAVKQYVASTFSHLLLNISGYSCCYRFLSFFPWRKRY